jgi:hypothetical protein
MNKSLRLIASLLVALLCGAAAPPGTPAARLEAIEAQYPPWTKGGNNDASDQGFVFTVPPADSMSDFHGNLTDPALVLYASGNYYFALEPIREVWIHDEAFAASRLSMMRIMARRTKAATVVA